MLSQDIDKKILRIQESTRTSLPFFIPVHNVLRMRFNWYYRWHLLRGSNFVHFALLALFAVGMFAAVYNQAVPKSLATNENDGFVRINTEEGWNAGTKTNIDATSIPGSIKINQASPQKTYIPISAGQLTASPSAGAGNIIDRDNCSAWRTVDEGSYFQIDLGEVINDGYTSWLSSNNPGVSYGAFGNPPSVSTNGTDWTPMPFLEMDNSPAGVCNSDVNDWRYVSGPSTFRYIKVTAFPVGDPPYYFDGPTNDFKVYTIDSSATHISAPTQMDNQNENASWTTFDVTASVPAQSTLQVRFRTSLDAETWGPWTNYADYASSINIGTLLGDENKKKQYLQVESLLTSLDGIATPTVSSYTANFAAICPANTTEDTSSYLMNTTTKWDLGATTNITTEGDQIAIENKALYTDIVGNLLSSYISYPYPGGTIDEHFDLGQTFTNVSRVSWSAAGPAGTLLFSTDNENWETAALLSNFSGETDFEPRSVRYVRITDTCGYQPSCAIDTVRLYKLSEPAIHTSAATQIDGTSNISSWTTFVPSGSIPANTSIKFRFRTSDDASTWGSWTALTNYAASINIATLLGETDQAKRYLQVETTLANTDGASTPTLTNYTANYIACTPIEEEPSCSDGIQNQGETAVDCGGPCDPCPVPETCSDGILNQNEIDTDCGGVCEACPVEPTCSDGIQNQGEPGVDCGGPCTACPVEPTCSDGVQNGDETDVDCGGSCEECEEPKLCQNGELQECLANVDTSYQTCLENAKNDPAQIQACYSLPCGEASQCYLSCGMAGADQFDLVHVISPNGSEEYTAGRQVEIKWDYTTANSIIKETMAKNNYAVRFSLSTDSGSSYREIKTLVPKDRYVSWIANGTPIGHYLTKDKNGNTSAAGPELANGYLSHLWEIPSDTALISDQVRVKLEPFASCFPVTEDVSDDNFRIKRAENTTTLEISVSPAEVKIKSGEQHSFTATAKLSDGSDVTNATTFGFNIADGGKVASQSGNTVTIQAGDTAGNFENAITITGVYQNKTAETTASLEVYTDVIIDDIIDEDCVGICIKERFEEFISDIKGSNAVSAASLAVAALLALGIGLLNIAGNLATASGSNIFSFFVKGVSKKDTRGTVYDAITGLSIPYATVILTDLKTSQSSFAISDKDGQFSISVSPGQQYTVKAEKLKYDLYKGYNSTKVKRFELKYSHNYLGGTLEIPRDTYLFDYNIPMIPTETDSTARKVNLLASIGKALTLLNYLIILVGLVFAFYATFFSPSLYNWIVFTLYIVLIIILIIKYLFLNGHNYGVVADASGKPVELALVRAVRVKTGKMVKTIATDKNGKFGMALPVGVYHVHANKAGMQQTNETDAIIGSAFKPARVKVKMDKYSNDTIKGDSQTDVISGQQKNAASEMSSGPDSSANSADEIIKKYNG